MCEGGVGGGSPSTAIVPWSLVASLFLVCRHLPLKCEYPSWSIVSHFSHRQSHLSYYLDSHLSLMDAVHLPISLFPGQPFATEPVRVAKLLAVLSVLPFPVASSMRKIICCIYSAVVPRCRGEMGSVYPLLTHTSLPGLSAFSHLFIFSDVPFTSETLAQRGEDSGDSLPPYPHLPSAVSSR